MPKLPGWIILALLCLGTAPAATFYVSPTGNNAATGLTEATALATPQAAIDQAVPGDTILLRGGNYPLGAGRMAFNPLKHRGSDSAWLPFTLPAVGQAVTVTDTVDLSTQPHRFLRLLVSAP